MWPLTVGGQTQYLGIEITIRRSDSPLVPYIGLRFQLGTVSGPWLHGEQHGHLALPSAPAFLGLQRPKLSYGPKFKLWLASLMPTGPGDARGPAGDVGKRAQCAYKRSRDDASVGRILP